MKLLVVFFSFLEIYMSKKRVKQAENQPDIIEDAIVSASVETDENPLSNMFDIDNVDSVREGVLWSEILKRKY